MVRGTELYRGHTPYKNTFYVGGLLHIYINIHREHILYIKQEGLKRDGGTAGRRGSRDKKIFSNKNLGIEKQISNFYFRKFCFF
jgi:hypothetical protein